MLHTDRFFTFERGEPVEITREEAGYDFVFGRCKAGVTRVSPDEPPFYFTIHCDGCYWPGALERLQDMLNSEERNHE